MARHKLTLKLEELEVTSFQPSPDGEAPLGTVHGQATGPNPHTCFSHCWSLCLADSDCCTDGEPTYCKGDC